jgi:prolipoprotein diacylglyceryltransferase
LVLGIAINIGLGARLGLPLITSLSISLLGLSLIPVVAMTIKLIRGKEELCFYHHLISVMAVTALVLWLLGKQILPFLDVLILAIGAARAFGFFGCLMAGCCHGRPSRWGVVYGDQYEGIVASSLIGVRLFPTQILESIATFGIVLVGGVIIFNEHIPGWSVGWFVATYCCARFFFECARWPPNYQFKSGLSQHQWISVVLVLFVVSLEFAGLLPFRFWHAIVLLLLLVATAVLVIERRLRSMNEQLTHPEHVRELGAAINLALDRIKSQNRIPTTSDFATIPIGSTSLGVQISAGKITREDGDIYHYALSLQSGLSKASADSLAMAIVRLQSFAGPFEVLTGNRGVFHVLVHSARSESL